MGYAVDLLRCRAGDEPKQKGLELLVRLALHAELQGASLRCHTICGPVELTCCGSDEWLVEHEGVVIIQLFCWC